MGTVREIRRLRRRVRVGAPDPSLTPVSGLAAVTELVDRLNMITLLDAAIGPIKTRDRGFTGGELLVGMASAAAGRGGLPGRTGPPTRRRRRAGPRAGAGVELHHRGRAGTEVHRRAVARGGDRDR